MLFQIDFKCNISATGWIRGFFFMNCTNIKKSWVIWLMDGIQERVVTILEKQHVISVTYGCTELSVNEQVFAGGGYWALEIS